MFRSSAFLWSYVHHGLAKSLFCALTQAGFTGDDKMFLSCLLLKFRAKSHTADPTCDQGKKLCVWVGNTVKIVAVFSVCSHEKERCCCQYLRCCGGFVLSYSQKHVTAPAYISHINPNKHSLFVETQVVLVVFIQNEALYQVWQDAGSIRGRRVISGLSHRD